MTAKKKPARANPPGKESSESMASLAARVLRTGKFTTVEVMALAGCVMSQSDPNRE